jgi:nitrite reductase/ring-hydroxylating ferredoxin subunit
MILLNKKTCKSNDNDFSLNFKEVISRKQKRFYAYEAKDSHSHNPDTIFLIDGLLDSNKLATVLQYLDFYIT